MKISIIGGGNMGGAIAKGLSNSKFIEAKDITVVNRRSEKNIEFQSYGLNSVANDYSSMDEADVVILAIKPWDVKSFVEKYQSVLSDPKRLIVSVAAGIDLKDLQKWLNKDVGIYHVMPNTAIEVNESMTFVSSLIENEESDRIVMKIFANLGKVLMIEERKMNAAMALCSCGIAFAMRYIRASMEGGIELGLSSEMSKSGVLQTLKGAVALLEATDSHPEVEIDKVTTPGGITIKGINELEHCGFSSAVIKGLKSCN